MPNPSLFFGLALGLGCLVAALRLEGLDPVVLVNGPSLLVVLGGAMSATIVGFHTSDLRDLRVVLRNLASQRSEDRFATADLILELSKTHRRAGRVQLEEAGAKVEDPFLAAGLQLIADGSDAHTLERVMERRINSEIEHLGRAEAMLESMGGYCPTFGILGTVFGLVGTLTRSQQPGQILPGVATAFSATLYGLGFANLLFLPLAARIRRRTAEREEYLEMLLTGLISIRADEPPYTLEDRLRPYLVSSIRTREPESDPPR